MTIPNDESECPPISNLKVSDDMATAKELRAAAELLRACYSTDKCNDLTPGYEQAADLLSDHILATVREDDDEPVTPVFATRVGKELIGHSTLHRRWLLGSYPCGCSVTHAALMCDTIEETADPDDVVWMVELVTVEPDDEMDDEFKWHKGFGHNVQVCGDVRRLCTALGIPLPSDEVKGFDQ